MRVRDRRWGTWLPSAWTTTVEAESADPSIVHVLPVTLRAGMFRRVDDLADVSQTPSSGDDMIYRHRIITPRLWRVALAPRSQRNRQAT